MYEKSDSRLQMKEYKKKTIKQLREEMNRRSIGYMSNWTKPVLIKRLEEEDAKSMFRPDAQMELFNVQLTSLELETKDIIQDNKELSEKQQRALELNNQYAKAKSKNNDRLKEIEAQRKFILTQKKSVEDALDPNW